MANLLLIEDDDAQRLVAAYSLKKAGHEVREASNGSQGLTAARLQRPDVVVCDVMMPGMSGYEVVAALRADADLASVPVVLLTAMSDRKHMRQGMTAGADDYLTKPYGPDELIDAVAALVARRQVQHDAFINSMSGMVETALERQKEALGRQYESQLQREINARWARADAATDMHYEHAYVLLAELLRGDLPAGPALAERVKQAQQSARDTLYLFGATHVLPYGSKLLAVFDGDDATVTTPAELRVLRAAIALAKAAPRDRPVTVAIHAGPIALVAVDDGLHGDQGHALVPGDSVNMVSALEEHAAAHGWRMAASEPMAKALAGEVSLGRRTTTKAGVTAIEILGLAST
jgi:DNA-binding response OmpR family regulator